MSSRLRRLARLAAGGYTPYLAANWDNEERAILDAWRKGDPLVGACEQLQQAMLQRLGEGWSGTGANLARAAIQATLEALRLPKASEVLLPSYACAGVVVPVLQAGLRPVLVDVDDDLNISFESVAAAESPEVRAVIVPHFGGLWARDADAIFAWAREREMMIIEDAAQAQGLVRDGRPVGTSCDASVFSFGGGKLVFGPGGGFVATRDPQLGERIERRLDTQQASVTVRTRIDAFARRFAISTATRARRELRETLAARVGPRTPPGPVADEADPHGFELFALSNIDAALAGPQTKAVDALVAAHVANANRWHRLLGGLDGVRLAPRGNNVFTKLWAVVEGNDAEARATVLRRILRRHGVETETLYVPLHLRPEFVRLRSTPLPATERLWRAVFALPARPGLGDSDWQRIEAAAEEIRHEWR